jgi:two-component system, LytTR family, response regulator
MIKCIIVDDEQHAIDVLVHYVKQIPQLELAGCYTNPLQALQAVMEQKIDLAFLDIQMPELSGIDFIKTLNQKSRVILTTAYKEFALEGYELYVTDYLLKPVRLPRFIMAVQKVIEQVNATQPAQQDVSVQDYIFVKTETKGKLLKIMLSEIDYIESEKNYMAIHCNGKKILVFTSMRELEERLPKQEFIRVHKSYIIPIAKITGIEGNTIRLRNSDTGIILGENYKSALMEKIKNRMI